jgi:hypothetical protein
MSDRKSKSGRLVRTKSGTLGRTFNSDGLINGKVPVYPSVKSRMVGSIEVPTEYSEKAILCEIGSLEQIGFLD